MASQTSEFYQYYPSYDVIIPTCGMAVTAANALQQGLGTYIDIMGDTLYLYGDGKCRLKVKISNKNDVQYAVKAFTRYNGQTDDRAREQLQSLVNDYIRMSR